MSGFSRCHRFVLYSWHITVPSVRRRQCSANPDGNAFASGVHCALAIDDQPTRTISATAELDMFFRHRFCICVPRLASQRLVSQIKIVTINAPMRSTSGSSDGVRAYYRHCRVNWKHSWHCPFVADQQSTGAHRCLPAQKLSNSYFQAVTLRLRCKVNLAPARLCQSLTHHALR